MANVAVQRIAEGIGTSQSMLIYHFTSADKFWESVLRAVRHRELIARTRLPDDLTGPLKAIEDAWKHFSSEAYLPVIRLLFELYGKAMRELERFGDFLNDAVYNWGKPLTEMFAALGFSAAEAQARAQIQVATVRGLLLQLLATGDRVNTTKVMKHFARLITRADP